MLSVRVRKALPGFTLDVAWEAGREVVALFGASGSGKSLTLQAIAGLVAPDEGRIAHDGATWFDCGPGAAARVDVPPRARRPGYVFQGYALFPHLTVAGNLAFGLADRPRAERARRVAELAEQLGIADVLARRPRELSGGQQQRVALGRALAAEPSLLLLDEPLSALDAPLRRQLRDDLAVVLRRFARTTVLVTHDVGEAFHLADRVVVYDRGRVVQAAPKAELLTAPASEQVASLLGVRNILRGRVASVAADFVEVEWRGHRLRAANPAARPYAVRAGDATAFFVRPEHIRLARKDRAPLAEKSHLNRLAGAVVDVVDLGTSYALLFAVDGAREGGAREPGAPAHDLEVEVSKLVFEMLDVARERRWEVGIQPSAVQLLPG